MELVTEKPRQFVGIKITTSNEAERNHETAQIHGMWTEFMTNVAGKMVEPAVYYGVYSEYESDMNGPYSLAATVEVVEGTTYPDELSIVQSPGGNYAVFRNSGTMPDVVFQTWSEIWEYFSAEDCPHERAYTADYEEFASETEVAIYVSVK